MAKGAPQAGSESDRRLEVLLEQIRSEVHSIAEGHSLLVNELQTTRQMLEKRLEFLEKATIEGFGKIWESQQRMTTRLDELVTRFDVHERTHAV